MRIPSCLQRLSGNRSADRGRGRGDTDIFLTSKGTYGSTMQPVCKRARLPLCSPPRIVEVGEEGVLRNHGTNQLSKRWFLFNQRSCKRAFLPRESIAGSFRIVPPSPFRRDEKFLGEEKAEEEDLVRL